MKKLVLSLCLSVIMSALIAQQFTNFYSGYRENYSVVSDDSLIYVGCGGVINIYRKDGSFKAIKPVTFGVVYSSVRDYSGNIWFGIYSYISGDEKGGLLKYDGNTWEFIPLNNPVNEYCLNDVTCDLNNNIWVTINSYAGFGALIAKYNGTEWTNYHVFGDTVTLNDATQIVCDTNNIIYAGITSNYSGGSNGIIAISETDTVIYTASNSNLEIACKHSSYVDRNNNVWFGGCYKKLNRFDGEEWHQEAQDTVPGYSFYSIYQDTAGYMWLGTPGGLFVENESDWAEYLAGEELIFDYIYDITSDNEENIWIATFNNPGADDNDMRKGCLTKYDEDGFHNYFPNTHIGRPKQINFINNKTYTYSYSPLSVFDGNTWDIDHLKYPRAIAGDADGNTWIGTTDGLYKLISGNIYEQIEVLCDDTISSAQCIGTLEDIVWVIANGSDLYKFSENVWTKTNMTGHGLSSASRIFIRDENEIWVTSLNSTFKYDGNQYTIYDTTIGFLPHQYINDICFTGDSIWFATRYGAVLIYNSELSFHCNDSSFSSGYSNLQTVQVDKNGLIWFGNKKGAMTYDGENITYIQPSGHEEEIYTIREDPEQNLWFCGEKAVSKYTFDNSNVGEFIKDKKNLQIFPNPANEYVSVYITENNNTEILGIYTITGSLLKTFAVNAGSNKISLKDINPGIYFLRAQKSGLSAKLVVK